MTNQEKFEYWLDAAEYDIETANAMLNSGRWLYVVYACQQAIEKLIKGLYILYIDDNVPRIHNLRVLIDKIEHLLPEKPTDEQLELFDRLTYFYVNGRYTDYKQKLSQSLNEADAKSYFIETKEGFKWLLTMKP